jgi:hypothetical protein
MHPEKVCRILPMAPPGARIEAGPGSEFALHDRLKPLARLPLEGVTLSHFS